MRSSHTVLSYVAFSIIALSSAGCRDGALEPAAPDSASTNRPLRNASSMSGPNDTLFGSDAEFAKLATRIPGFGGLFFDAKGQPSAYLVDPNNAGAASSVLQPLLPNAARAISFRRGRWDFLQLSAWKTALEPTVLAIPGVVFLDIDESLNRVRIGIRKQDIATDVSRLTESLGIPDSALAVEVMPPAKAFITLRDLNTPRAAGFQINWGTSFQYLCTIGPNAYFAGDTTAAYGVINSHCTDVQGQVTGTTYYQPQYGTPFTYVGTETADPGYWIGGQCPAGQRCRTADAALFKYATAHPPIYQVGYIAKTTYPDYDLGSIVMDTTKPRIKITQTGNWPYTGQWLHKVGRTTGWTYGVTRSTCVDFPQYNEYGYPTGITMLCQDVVDAGAGPGDSGSPVFEYDHNGDAALEGILWGGDGAGNFIMSPIQNVKNELGNLVFNAP